ncbi:hypothetical protein AAFC00_003791 [Neodothiora populina]|uniref:N-acetyltransferase domain-containing protein n=1 Tax=Neodothiora populina TaxID=2781224 RepID=A0ABR3PFQ7_9PEZI
MPLELRPLRPADLPAYNRIKLHAFSIPNEGLMPMFHPNGYTPADATHDMRSTLSKISDPTTADDSRKPYPRFMIVVDTDLAPLEGDVSIPLLKEKYPNIPPEVIQDIEVSEGEQSKKTASGGRPIGISAWEFYPKPRTPEDLAAEDAQNAAEPLAPTTDSKFMAAFFGTISRVRRDNLGGNPHAHLQVLAVDPDHHRRGVGAMCLDWGFVEADRLGIPVYLESSRLGRPLYLHKGFQELHKLDFDARAASGGKGFDAPHSIMFRPVTTKQA